MKRTYRIRRLRCRDLHELTRGMRSTYVTLGRRLGCHPTTVARWDHRAAGEWLPRWLSDAILADVRLVGFIRGARRGRREAA